MYCELYILFCVPNKWMKWFEGIIHPICINGSVGKYAPSFSIFAY